MDTNEALAALRKRGHQIGTPYVQLGVEPQGRIYVVVDGVAITEPEVRDLALGRTTLEQCIAARSAK